MPSNLPQTYKAAVFKEAGKPLEFEERKLQMPEDGQVSEDEIAYLLRLLTPVPDFDESLGLRSLSLGLCRRRRRLR